MSFAIRTANLSKKFHRLEALSGLNLEVAEGSIYAFVGPNGAGKTTTIKILTNILRPSSGQSEVLGIPSPRLSGHAFSNIGYVSENQELPEWMTVSAFLRYLRPFYPNWDPQLEHALVKQLDLPFDRKIRHLSRGMKMKAALASSLAYHPKLIILDEPFGGLDPLVRDQLIEALLERAAESTLFISSHDLAEIETFASHIGYLDQGKLLFSEELSALSNRFREVELTLDPPLALPSAIPDTWLHLKASGGVVRFIDSSFEEERTRADVSRLFPSMRDAAVRPMTLRAIFLAMAKTASKS
jgi:ABC-type multidrug transport system ATPase subunit